MVRGNHSDNGFAVRGMEGFFGVGETGCGVVVVDIIVIIDEGKSELYVFFGEAGNASEIAFVGVV